MSDTQTKELLDEQDIEALVMSLAESRGEKPFTEEEAITVLEWAKQCRADYVLLKMVLDGSIQVDVRGGEVVFVGEGR